MSDRDLYDEFRQVASGHFNTMLQGMIGIPMYLSHRMLDQEFKDMFREEPENGQSDCQSRAAREVREYPALSRGVFDRDWDNMVPVEHDGEYNSAESQTNQHGESVISTSTQSISRTFPDGSTVTKTISARHFADGSNERMENEHKTPPKCLASADGNDGRECSRQRITDLTTWPRDEFMKVKQQPQRHNHKIDVQVSASTPSNHKVTSDTQRVEDQLNKRANGSNERTDYSEVGEGKAKRRGWFWS